jgi:hypothetical protein
MSSVLVHYERIPGAIGTLGDDEILERIDSWLAQIEKQMVVLMKKHEG